MANQRLYRRRTKGLPGFEEPDEDEADEFASSSIAANVGSGSTAAVVQSALEADIAHKKAKKQQNSAASSRGKRSAALAEDDDEEDNDGEHDETATGRKAEQKFSNDAAAEHSAQAHETGTGKVEGTVREDLVGTASRKRAHARQTGDEDTDIAHDFRGLEEDTGVREDDGNTIEPFSMENERREGLIDEEGNFAKLKNREGVHANDTWLMDERNVVDPSLAHKAQQRSEVLAAGNAESLSDSQLSKLKSEAASYLCDGESVLAALKRLRPQSFPTTAERRKRKRKASSEQQYERQQQQQQESQLDRQQKRQKLERLTELADALFHNGEYDVYSSTKRQLERESQLYTASAEPAEDMFVQ